PRLRRIASGRCRRLRLPRWAQALVPPARWLPVQGAPERRDRHQAGRPPRAARSRAKGSGVEWQQAGSSGSPSAWGAVGPQHGIEVVAVVPRGVEAIEGIEPRAWAGGELCVLAQPLLECGLQLRI